jgi:hypothetical protein
MPNLANLFFRAAFVFFAIGVSMGVFMGMTHDFTLRPVHVHVNLLGWVSFFLYAAFYKLFPAAAATRLAKAHFWTALVGLPPMMAGLAVMVHGNEATGVPLLLAGQAVVVASIVIFIIIGFRATARTAPVTAARMQPAE